MGDLLSKSSAPVLSKHRLSVAAGLKLFFPIITFISYQYAIVNNLRSLCHFPEYLSTFFSYFHQPSFLQGRLFLRNQTSQIEFCQIHSGPAQSPPRRKRPMAVRTASDQ